jgi:uncharacterized protein (TIGR02466 family)
MTAQVMGLFPTPVMTVKALAPERLRRSIVEDARRKSKSANVHDGRLAHTEMIRPEDNVDFGRLADLLAPHLSEFGALLLGEKLRWLVKEMWVNLLQNGGHQAMHNHANSFVSVVLYLTPTGEGARTVFHRPIGGGDFAFANENRGTTMTPFNAKRWVAPAMEPGDALFFPSYLLHEVPANPGGERITVALNALPERVDSWGYAVRFA